jgi:hypothetical protein
LLGTTTWRRLGWYIEGDTGPRKDEDVRTDFVAADFSEMEKLLGYDKVYRRIADNNNKILINDLGGIHKMPFIPVRKDDLHAMVNQA